MQLVKSSRVSNTYSQPNHLSQGHNPQFYDGIKKSSLSRPMSLLSSSHYPMLEEEIGESILYIYICLMKEALEVTMIKSH